MITNEERRRMARALRGGYDVVSDVGGRFWLNGTLFGLDISARSEERIRCGLRHLAGLIDPGPRAEEIAAKAYRAAADYVDWNIPDSEERVRKLREQAEELEAMARERESGQDQDICPESIPQASGYDLDTTVPAADTTKCDRKALLSLADRLEKIAAYDYCSEDLISTWYLSDVLQDTAMEIRDACEEGTS